MQTRRSMLLTTRSAAFLLAQAIVACGLPLAAQTPGPCGAPVTGFLIEHPVDLTTIKSTVAQSLPAGVSGQLATGTQEVRSRTSYSVATRILRNDLFMVTKGSPIPTPAATNIDSSRISFTVVY